MGAENQIDYIEFQAADLTATRAFFEQLFGWKFTDLTRPSQVSGFRPCSARLCRTVPTGSIRRRLHFLRRWTDRRWVRTCGSALDDRVGRRAGGVLSSATGGSAAAGDRSRWQDHCRYFLFSWRAPVSFHRAKRERVRNLVGRSGRREELGSQFLTGITDASHNFSPNRAGMSARSGRNS